MAYDFLDNFEGIDEEALNIYDANYTIFVVPNASIKIDTARSYHATASCRIYIDVAGSNPYTQRAVTPRASGFIFQAINVDSDSRITAQMRLMDAGNTKIGTIVQFQQVSTAFVGAKAITYYDATVLTDSGLRFVKDTWYVIKTQFDKATKLYSAWIKGGLFLSWTQICAGANFYNTATWAGENIGVFWLRAFWTEAGGAAWNVWFDGLAYGPADEGYPYDDVPKPYGHWRY